MLHISGQRGPVVSHCWINAVEGVPAQSTSRSCVSSRGGSAFLSHWTWEPWRRDGRQARTGGGWLKGCLPSDCTVCPLPAEVTQLLWRYWAVCSGGGPRAPSGDWRPQEGGRGALASLPFLAHRLKGGEGGSHPCVQSPRQGLPCRVRLVGEQLIQQQGASPAACIINLIPSK